MKGPTPSAAEGRRRDREAAAASKSEEAQLRMQVSVSSRHTELAAGLRAAAVEKIGRLDRFLEGMDRAEVHFSQEASRRKMERQTCEVTLEGHGHHVRCKVSAADPLTAIDLAVEKLEQQLTKLKSRRSRKVVAARKVGSPAESGVLDGEVGDGDASMADDAYIARDGSAIVKRKSFAARPMTVDDAVLQLDLLDHDFFLFTNAENGNCAVLYRRHHGGLGLIEQVP
jgi:ribosome hibernation promoting factor